MNPIYRILDRIKALFVKDAAEMADILTEGVIAVFTAAHDTLDQANVLYQQAHDDLVQEIENLHDALDAAAFEQDSLISGINANERRKAKLAEFFA